MPDFRTSANASPSASSTDAIRKLPERLPESLTRFASEGFAAAGIGNPVGDLRALACQRFRLGARAIIDGDAMAGLYEVARHWRTHVAKPNETDVHRLILFVGDSDPYRAAILSALTGIN